MSYKNYVVKINTKSETIQRSVFAVNEKSAKSIASNACNINQNNIITIDVVLV